MTKRGGEFYDQTGRERTTGVPWWICKLLWLIVLRSTYNFSCHFLSGASLVFVFGYCVSTQKILYCRPSAHDSIPETYRE